MEYSIQSRRQYRRTMIQEKLMTFFEGEKSTCTIDLYKDESEYFQKKYKDNVIIALKKLPFQKERLNQYIVIKRDFIISCATTQK